MNIGLVGLENKACQLEEQTYQDDEAEPKKAQIQLDSDSEQARNYSLPVDEAVDEEEDDYSEFDEDQSRQAEEGKSAALELLD